MIEINPAVYSDLSEIAIKFGPFFFSLIFCLVLMPLTHKWYSAIAIRNNPAPSRLERNTYRFIFFGSFIFSIVLITVCVLWWLSIQNDLKIIRGEIQDVNDYIEVTSPDVFLQNKRTANLPYKDISYVLLYQPKDPPKNLRFILRKDGSSNYNSINVKFTQCKINPDYKYIETDTSKYFKEIAQYKRNGLNLFPVSYAAKIRSENIENHTKVTSVIPVNLENLQTINPYFIQRLQDDKTPVGEKIQVLNQLIYIEDQNILNEYMNYSTDKEPFIITIVDLKNHNDKEIASLSQRLLEKVNSVDIISNLINYSISPREFADRYLWRLDEDLAREIINRQNPQRIWANEYKENINSLPFEQNKLYPVGSIEGDRYYIKAIWNQDNPDEVECLTQLFNRIFLGKRPIEEEREIMNSKSYRTVYWYSKEWALNVAEQIEECGGRSSFVTLYEIQYKR